MGKIFIIISTVLLLIIIGTRNAKNNRRLFTSLKRLISEINNVYKDLFKDMSMVKRITQGGLIIGSRNIYSGGSFHSCYKAHRYICKFYYRFNNKINYNFYKSSNYTLLYGIYTSCNC